MYVMLTLRIVFVIVDNSLIPNSRGDIILIYMLLMRHICKRNICGGKLGMIQLWVTETQVSRVT